MEIPRFVDSFLFSLTFVRSCECVCLPGIDNAGRCDYIDERVKEIDGKNSAAIPVIKYKRYVFETGNAQGKQRKRSKKIKKLPANCFKRKNRYALAV